MNSLLFSLLVSLAENFETCKCSLCQAQASTHKQAKKIPFTETFVTVGLIISTKNRDTSSYAQNFLIPETFTNTKGFPYEIFG